MVYSPTTGLEFAQIVGRCCKVTKYNVILPPHFYKNASVRTRSSMDRIKDSGSFDWGSTPHGFTRINANNLIVRLLAFGIV